MRTYAVDPDDADAFAPWFAPVVAADRFLGPDQPLWLDVELRAIAQATGEARRVLTAIADDDDVVVGAAMTVLPLLENLDTAELMIFCVHPERRRRGIGSRLFEAVEALAAAEGRTVMVAPIEASLADGDAPGEAFVRAKGFTRALESAKRCIDLPVDGKLLDRLEREASPHATDYDIVTWTGPCPPELVAGRVALARSMSTDQPLGELELEPADWGEERLREFEALTTAMHRVLHTSGAVHRATGELVAFSDLAVSTIEPKEGYQYDTIVLGSHRGHRLGLLVKIANLRVVMAASPRTRTLYTWNAVVNDPMISVNEVLGFRRAMRGGLWQRRLDDGKEA